MQNVLQREFWNGQPEELRELFSLNKNDRSRSRCALWSHQFGWEVRLTVGGSLIRSQVCRDISEAIAAGADWMVAMIDQGWAAGE